MLCIILIGKGSFAKVYFATKNEDGKNFAIKAFNKEYMAVYFIYNIFQVTTQRKIIFNQRNTLKFQILIFHFIVRIMRNLNSEYCLRLYEMYETTNSIYFVVDLL